MKHAKPRIGAVLIFFASTNMVLAQENTFPSTGNVGIGTAEPTQRLTLGSGNVMLPSANFGTDGNLYFGGITDVGETRLRLFGGLVNGTIPAGFIDVRTTDPADGLRIRVDTAVAGTERMRVTADGNVGIGTMNPRARLDVNGTTRTGVLEITGGADLAEPFEVSATEAIVPGMLVSIDPEWPGQLRLTKEAYDRRVAGIVSGANGLNSGLTMGHDGGGVGGSLPVALTGRVYALADAANGPIEPGDLLTTSDTSGHAMKVTDYAQAQGAIIGKAMSALGEGRGFVLVLVALQ